jgi:hypothetical protein
MNLQVTEVAFILPIGKKRLKLQFVRFEAFTAVKMAMLVLWVVMPYGLTGRHHRYRET